MKRKMSNYQNVAIQFALYLLDRDVTKTSAGGPVLITEAYRPKEYDLMRGELMVYGDKLFEDFLTEIKYK